MTAADALLAVLLAPVCAVCALPLERPLRGAVCDGCWRRVQRLSEPLCRTCGDSLPSWRVTADGLCTRCSRSPRAISLGRAIGPYDGALREVLHALKYGKRRSLAAPLGRMMRDSGAAVLPGADFAVAVPLHFSRRYGRGFNQAEDLARALGMPVQHVLRRRRRTTTQTDLPEAERHANVEGAFALRRRGRRLVKGRTIVLVDDVSTTGATLDACAAVLLNAGAKEVRALTAARAPSRLR